MTAMLPRPELHVQYPLQCRVRSRIPLMRPTKVILHRVGGGWRTLPLTRDKQPRAPIFEPQLLYHSTHGLNASTCDEAVAGLGLIRHYSMTLSNMVSMRDKASLLQRQLKAKEPTWTVCGNVQHATGKCLDYELQCVRAALSESASRIRIRSLIC